MISCIHKLNTASLAERGLERNPEQYVRLLLGYTCARVRAPVRVPDLRLHRNSSSAPPQTSAERCAHIRRRPVREVRGLPRQARAALDCGAAIHVGESFAEGVTRQ